MTQRPPLGGDQVVAPSRTDPIAVEWSHGFGGPSGRRSRRHPWWTPIRVLLALATVTFAVAMLQKAPCVQTQWTDGSLRYAAMCYSDLPYLYTGRGLAEGVWPYSDTEGRYQVMEYPVGISYFAWATGRLTNIVGSGPTQAERAKVAAGDIWGLPGMVTEVNRYFVVNVVLLAAVGMLTTYLLALVHPRRPYDALWFAVSPCLLLTGFVNWDLLAVACVAGALLAWARGRPVLTGICLGIGTATKLYPLFLLGALLVICLRRRQMTEFAAVLVAGVVSWVALNVPAWITGMAQWQVFWTFNSDRGPDLGSVWLWFSLLGSPATPETVNRVSLVVFALACVAILVLGLRAPATPTFAQLGYLILAAFLITNKVYSPQYVLWLLPLAVLARPRWRDLIIWQAGEVFYFAAVWLYLGQFTASATTGAPDPLYLTAIIIRILAEIYLAAMIIRDLRAGLLNQ